MQAENKKNNINIVSLGCRLNALEAEKIKKMLSDSIDNAFLVNTCAVTGEAERQSGQTVRKLARENPNVPIFVTGCAATRNAELFSNIPNAIVIPNNSKMNINAYIKGINASSCDFTTPQIRNFPHPVPNLSKQFVQVQNGCNHKCAYCITRFLRGPAVSFEYKDILNDTKEAVANGFEEIVLTGVDTASYANNGMLISDVCKSLLHDIPGIKRLRISSMDPASPEIFKIIDLIKTDARMMPHMHLSMQSGSDEILQLMHRRHNAETVRKISKYAGKEITFSWDIICGFPGESQEKFQETLELVKETRPIKIHAFPFSARPGTEAFDMPNQIDKSVAKERVKTISELANKIRLEFMELHIGSTVSALIEENNLARTPHDISIKVQGEQIAPRTICDLRIIGIKEDDYIGIIV